MNDNETALTGAEWNVMECLWAASPRTGREVAEYLAKSVGYTRSTSLTMLRRMTEKGLILCSEGEMKVYSPLLRREDAVTRETDSFLNRVYKGSVSMMMSAMAQKQELSKAEIDELYTILREAEKEAKK